MSIVSNDMALAWIGLTGTITTADQTLLTVLLNSAERLVKSYLGYDILQATYIEFYPPANYRVPSDQLIAGYEMQGNRAVPIDRDTGNRRILALRQLPIRSVTTIYEDLDAWDNGVPPSFVTPVTVQDFQVDFESYDTITTTGISWTGFVFRRSGIWSSQERTIQVTYLAGLTAAELHPETGAFNEFALAILTTIGIWFNQVKMHQAEQGQGSAPGILTAQSLDGWSESYSQAGQERLYGFINVLPATAASILEHRVRIGKFFMG